MTTDSEDCGCCTTTYLILSIVVGYLIIQFLKKRDNDAEERARYKRLTSKRQEERGSELEKLKAEYKLTAQDEEILKLPTEELIDKLQKRSVTATQVLNAFLAKSIELTERTNCITQFIPQAKKWASELDALPQPKGPLHGLPFGVKEDHNIYGMDSTLGFAKYLYQPAHENANIVNILMELGAIPFCKTNVPQSLMSYACDNPIYGETKNSVNLSLGPGGSSGGSGSLVGGGGAVFATGSDIGGSLRIPALFQGVCSLRSTIRRLSDKNIKHCNPNLVGLQGVTGVITKDAKTQATIFEALTKDNLQNKRDALAYPVPWDDSTFKSKEPLRIGYYTSERFCPSLGDTEETIVKAKTALEAAGHTLVPFDVPDNIRIGKLYMDLINVDKGKHMLKLFANEEEGTPAKLLKMGARTPTWVKKASVVVLELLQPWISSNIERMLALMRCGTDAHTGEGLQKTMVRRGEMIEEVLSLMDKNNLDLLLCPGFPFAAITLENCAKLSFLPICTVIWNLVDFPAGVVKFGKESGKNIDSYNHENDMFLKIAQKAVRDSIDMPLGVQVVGRPFKEELVLRVLVQLEELSEKQ